MMMTTKIRENNLFRKLLALPILGMALLFGGQIATASAGCAFTAPTVAPTTGKYVTGGYPQGLTTDLVVKLPMTGGKVHCTTPAQGDQYRVGVRMQLWNGSTWGHNMDTYQDVWFFYNDTANVDRPLTCFVFSQPGYVWLLRPVPPTCPALDNHANSYLAPECVVQIPNPYTRIRPLWTIHDLVSGATTDIAGPSGVWDSCDPNN